MKQLEKILKGKKHLIFVDFEGTQFTHEIIATGLLKCEIDENGQIIQEDDGILFFTKAKAQVGKIVTDMTNITDSFLKTNGLSFEDSIEKMREYIGDDLNHTLFVCFGNNDTRMLIESMRISHPKNQPLAKTWLPHFFDLMTFMSQFIRDDKNNTFSLINFLKLYNIEPTGVSHNPLNDAKDLKNLYIKFLNDKELNKIFSVCSENTPSDERDTLIIELLYATGLRVSELVNIKVKDIDTGNKSIKVLGKGDKERIVLYNNHTSKALDIYLNDAYHIFNKMNSEYLILNHNGGKLSDRYVRMIIDKLVRKANLDIRISPHTIRHTFATDMLEEGADLMTVKELLGHESLNTTSIYTHITNEQIKKTYNMAHPRAKK